MISEAFVFESDKKYYDKSFAGITLQMWGVSTDLTGLDKLRSNRILDAIPT